MIKATWAATTERPALMYYWDKGGYFDEDYNALDLEGWWDDGIIWDDPTYDAQRKALKTFNRRCKALFTASDLSKVHVYVFLPERLIELSHFYPLPIRGAALPPMELVHVKGVGLAIHRPPYGGGKR